MASSKLWVLHLLHTRLLGSPSTQATPSLDVRFSGRGVRESVLKKKTRFQGGSNAELRTSVLSGLWYRGVLDALGILKFPTILVAGTEGRALCK